MNLRIFRIAVIFAGLLISVLIPHSAIATDVLGLPTGCDATGPETQAYAKCLLDDNEAVSSRPGFRSFFRRANFYYYHGAADLAIADYSQAIKPYGGDVPRGELKMAYFFRANTYHLNGISDPLAVADLTKVIALDPRFDQAYESRGTIYLKAGLFDLAIDDLSKAIELDSYIVPYFNRGLAYQGKGLLPEALADFTKTISLGPDFPYGYSHRGAVYEKLGLADKAIANYRVALVKDPTIKAAKDGLFEALGPMGDSVPHVSNCDIVWVVVDYEELPAAPQAKLHIHKLVRTTLERSVEGLVHGFCWPLCGIVAVRWHRRTTYRTH